MAVNLVISIKSFSPNFLLILVLSDFQKLLSPFLSGGDTFNIVSFQSNRYQEAFKNDKK